MLLSVMVMQWEKWGSIWLNIPATGPAAALLGVANVLSTVQSSCTEIITDKMIYFCMFTLLFFELLFEYDCYVYVELDVEYIFVVCINYYYFVFNIFFSKIYLSSYANLHFRKDSKTKISLGFFHSTHFRSKIYGMLPDAQIYI